MNDETLKALKRIERLLTRIADRIAPETDEKKVSGASVSAVITEHGAVRDSGATGDVPSQLTNEERRTQSWVARPRRMRRE